jgi:hypothetical protein
MKIIGRGTGVHSSSFIYFLFFSVQELEPVLVNRKMGFDEPIMVWR